MSIRTRRTSATFARPFSVVGHDDLQPGGTYTVETDEELIDGLSFPAYRRIATSIFLPAYPARPGWAEVVQIDPLELDDATREVPTDDKWGTNIGGACVRRPFHTTGERMDASRDCIEQLRGFAKTGENPDQLREGVSTTVRWYLAAVGAEPADGPLRVALEQQNGESRFKPVPLVESAAVSHRTTVLEIALRMLKEPATPE